MTLTDAQNRADLLNLAATERDGFCCLHHPSGSLAARGDNWQECFDRWEAAQASARKLSGETPPPGPPEPGHLF